MDVKMCDFCHKLFIYSVLTRNFEKMIMDKNDTEKYTLSRENHLTRFETTKKSFFNEEKIKVDICYNCFDILIKGVRK